MTTEQMALAIALAALKKEKENEKEMNKKPQGGEGEEREKARAMAAAMVAWIEGQLAEGREAGRPPKNNFCFKCGAALHSTATFCADCGVKLPREGDTEVQPILLLFYFHMIINSFILIVVIKCVIYFLL
jgi:hypothetical protein